jgi:ATP-binding cassette, subfamily B, bacterial
VVSHRVATLNRFDMVLVMDHGQIIDTGSPSELLKRSGLYRHLIHHDRDGSVPLGIDQATAQGARA